MTAPKTYAAMLKQIAELQQQAESLRKREVIGVIKRINDAMKAYNLTPADLAQKPAAKPKPPAVKDSITLNPLKGKKRPVKYRDKDGHTWSGGGSMPIWLREQVGAGKSIDEFLIKDVA